MKLHCIADEDTVQGFRLAGVPGHVAVSPADAAAALAAVLNGGEVGVLIVTDRVADGIRDIVDRIRFERDSPIIVEIPGPDGALAGHQRLEQIAQEAVGMRLEPTKGL